MDRYEEAEKTWEDSVFVDDLDPFFFLLFFLFFFLFT
jgi:hypothetical protein